MSMVTAEELMQSITTEDVTDILVDMGSEEPRFDRSNNLYFTTVCHGSSSRKLHYFTDSKFFMCYTSCGSMSFYDVLMSINGWSFRDAFRFLAKYKGIKLFGRRVGLQRQSYDVKEELNFLNVHLQSSKQDNKLIKLPKYDQKILKVFDNYYPSTWIEEGIKEDVMQHFNVKFYFNQMKAIIPHYDIKGDLVGIKSRNFLQSEIDAGRKYMPITIQGLTYRYPVGFNLYGIYQNLKAIQKTKTAILLEGEKSVYKSGSYFGQENNIALATQGMNLTIGQRDLLLDVGVKNIILAFDKQYIVGSQKSDKEQAEYIAYFKKILRVTKTLLNYFNVYVILCWDDRLDYKDSPVDKGKEIFDQLYQERYLVESLQEIEELIN